MTYWFEKLVAPTVERETAPTIPVVPSKPTPEILDLFARLREDNWAKMANTWGYNNQAGIGDWAESVDLYRDYLRNTGLSNREADSKLAEILGGSIPVQVAKKAVMGFKQLERGGGLAEQVSAEWIKKAREYKEHPEKFTEFREESPEFQQYFANTSKWTKIKGESAEEKWIREHGGVSGVVTEEEARQLEWIRERSPAVQKAFEAEARQPSWFNPYEALKYAEAQDKKKDEWIKAHGGAVGVISEGEARILEEKEWIKEHGGKVGVVTEEEARKLERSAFYKKREERRIALVKKSQAILDRLEYLPMNPFTAEWQQLREVVSDKKALEAVKEFKEQLAKEPEWQQLRILSDLKKSYETKPTEWQQLRAEVAKKKEAEGPTMSLEDWDKQFFKEKGWKYDIRRGIADQREISLHDYQTSISHAEYEKQFGTTALRESQIGRGLSFVYSPARAIRPEVKWEDISPTEKILGVGQITLYALGPGGIVPGVTGAALRAVSTGISAAAFSTVTVMEWDKMTPKQRVMSIGFDALLWAGFAYQIPGIKSDVQAAKAYYETPLAKSLPKKLKGTAFEKRLEDYFVELSRAYRRGDAASMARAEKLYRQLRNEVMAKGYAPQGGWEPYALAAGGTPTKGNPTTALIVRNVEKMEAQSPVMQKGAITAKATIDTAVTKGEYVKITTPITQKAADLFAKGWVYNKAEKAWYKPVEVAKEVAPVTPEVTKEPWQMTRVEFESWYKERFAVPDLQGHKVRVMRALSEGKPVPAEVLKDYPDLAKPMAEVLDGIKRPTPGTLEYDSFWADLTPRQQAQELSWLALNRKQLPLISSREIERLKKASLLEKVTPEEFDVVMEAFLGKDYPEYKRLLNLPPERIQPIQTEAVIKRIASTIREAGAVWDLKTNVIYAPTELARTAIPKAEAISPTTPEAIARTEWQTGTYTPETYAGVEDWVTSAGEFETVTGASATGKPIIEPTPSPIDEVAGKAVEDPIAKLNQLLKEAKPLRGEIETQYTKERGRRIAEVERFINEQIDNVGGEEGYAAILSKLKGPLIEPEGRIKFEPIKDKLTADELKDLYIRAWKHPYLDNWEKISAADGLSRLLGGEIPQPKQLVLLEEIYGTELIKNILTKRAFGVKARDLLIEIANIPRAILATADISGFLRQCIVEVISHPIVSTRAMGKTFQFGFSPASFKQYFEDLPNHPLYPLMRKSKLALTDPSRASMVGREEPFISRLLQKIPVLRVPFTFAERCYVGLLTKIRVDLFSDWAKELQSKGLSAVDDIGTFRAVADVINTFTGRGNIGKLSAVAPALNTVFFSPRLIVARFQALNPVWYAQMPKVIRQKAIRDFALFVLAGLATLAAAKFLGGDELSVEADPRSSDFGKIRIGNTRWDIWGGFQQWVRVFAQVITGERKNTTTGEIISLNKEEYPFTTRKEVLLRFIEGKLAPTPALVNELMSGAKTFTGEDITFETTVREKFIPMYIQDIMEAYRDGGLTRAIAAGVPAFFGVGVQTWGFSHKEAQQRISDAEKQLGQTLRIAEGGETYMYDMMDLGAEIRKSTSTFTTQDVTEKNGFSPLTVYYEESKVLIDKYYALPASQREVFLKFRKEENIAMGAALVIWGKLKITGYVKGNPRTIERIKKLVKEYKIPQGSIPGLGISKPT